MNEAEWKEIKDIALKIYISRAKGIVAGGAVKAIFIQSCIEAREIIQTTKEVVFPPAKNPPREEIED